MAWSNSFCFYVLLFILIILEPMSVDTMKMHITKGLGAVESIKGVAAEFISFYDAELMKAEPDFDKVGVAHWV